MDGQRPLLRRSIFCPSESLYVFSAFPSTTHVKTISTSGRPNYRKEMVLQQRAEETINNPC